MKLNLKTSKAIPKETAKEKNQTTNLEDIKKEAAAFIEAAPQKSTQQNVNKTQKNKNLHLSLTESQVRFLDKFKFLTQIPVKRLAIISVSDAMSSDYEYVPEIELGPITKKTTLVVPENVFYFVKNTAKANNEKAYKVLISIMTNYARKVLKEAEDHNNY